MQPCEGDRSGDAQSAGEGGTDSPGLLLGFVGFFDGASGVTVEILAGFRRREALGRPQQQSDPNAFFELRDHLGHSRLSDAELARRSRE